jgi:hypothetical protein
MTLQHKVFVRKPTNNQRRDAALRLMMIEDKLVDILDAPDGNALSKLKAAVALTYMRLESIIERSPQDLYGYAFTAEERVLARNCMPELCEERNWSVAAAIVAELDSITLDGTSATEDEVAYAVIKIARWKLARQARG